MGSIRGIKTKARAEERAAEARKRENQDRHWEEDYQTWQQDADPHYSEYFSDKRLCFRSGYPVLGNPLPQCSTCNVQDSCIAEFIDWINYWHFDPGNYERELEELEALQWEQDYNDWIEEQSQDE